MTKTVILAPHFDDVVIDCWFVLRHESDSIVMTVCARLPKEGIKTFWDRVCGESNSRKMVQIRRQENEEAISLSGHHDQILLDYLDGQYPDSDIDIDSLVSDILANSPKDAVFLAPVATSKIFRHKNHIEVRKAALKLIEAGHKVQFYPDSPYMTLPKRPNKKILQRLTSHAEKNLGLNLDYKVNILDADDQVTKLQALKTYKSQYTATNINSFGGLTRVVKRNYELLLVPKQSAS